MHRKVVRPTPAVKIKKRNVGLKRREWGTPDALRGFPLAFAPFA
jgi:hypothetical protein